MVEGNKKGKKVFNRQSSDSVVLNVMFHINESAFEDVYLRLKTKTIVGTPSGKNTAGQTGLRPHC